MKLPMWMKTMPTVTASAYIDRKQSREEVFRAGQQGRSAIHLYQTRTERLPARRHLLGPGICQIPYEGILGVEREGRYRQAHLERLPVHIYV